MRPFLLSLSLLYCFFSSAQQFSLHPAVINLPTTDELSVASVNVVVRNHSNSALTVDSLTVPTVYGTLPFFASGLGAIAANDSIVMELSFAPKHNIAHQFELLVHGSNGESRVLSVNAQGTYSKSYYSATENKSELDLRNALKTIITTGAVNLGYTTARDRMYGQIDNQNGMVECVYTGRTATFNTRSGANSNNFNTEHTFPQSFFNSNDPMLSDLHHLFPTDVNANSQRGNLPFGVVSGSGTWSSGGSKKGTSSFEPRDAHKGDCARAMLYFVIRHADHGNFLSPQQGILRQWHEQFPPSAQSEARNNAVFTYQKNRNPFVDYPQFLHRMSSVVGASNPATINDVRINENGVDLGRRILSQAQDSVFALVAVANYGNTSITLDNFAFSTGNHLALNAAANVVLASGSGYEFKIWINPEDSVINTHFEFEIEGQPMSVPITGIVVSASGSGIASSPILWPVVVYPNPSNGILHLNKEVTSAALFDLNGKHIANATLNAQASEFYCEQCSGTYILELLLPQSEKQRLKVVFVR